MLVVDAMVRSAGLLVRGALLVGFAARFFVGLGDRVVLGGLVLVGLVERLRASALVAVEASMRSTGLLNRALVFAVLAVLPFAGIFERVGPRCAAFAGLAERLRLAEAEAFEAFLTGLFVRTLGLAGLAARFFPGLSKRVGFDCSDLTGLFEWLRLASLAVMARLEGLLDADWV